MGNKCCKNQSSTYSSANATIRSFSSYNSSILRSGGSHAITFGTSTLAGDSLTTLTMKSSNHSDVGSKDYRGGSSSTVGQEDLIPIFLRRLNDLNIRVGTRTRFLIELDDATDVQVRWYHNNVEANNERYQYIHEGGFYCLDIVPVTLFDEGLWVCTAQNYAGKSSTAAHLSLTVPKAFKKPIFVEQLKAVLTQRGIVSLECKVIGVPTPKLRWYKDDKEIKAGDIFALTANSEEDCLGIYTCEATNVMGTALSTSKIQVTHTPLDGNHDADSLIPYGPPPKFAKFLKDASGKVGSVLFLECQVDVPPWPRSIGWYNDNGIVNEGPLYHLMADGLGMYGVEIKSLRADHSTTWKCIATSSTGVKAVTSCVVSVSYPKNYRVPRFLESLRAIMTDEGLVSFECKVIGYPTPQLSWFKDGKQLQPGDVYELTGSKSLGSYCCVARNCMGETSSLAELTIEDIQNQLNESEKLQLTSNTQPPRFLLGLKSIEANINESFVFMIKVSTESTASISWYKEDEELTESNRYQFSTEDNGTYILNIMPLEIDDQAEWKCVAINKYGQTATSSFLKLNIPKNFKSPRFLEELRIAFSNEGSVNLECKVIGVPQPQLKWFKDGQELNPGDMHKIISGQSGTCCLGTYTCQAHNCMGTVSSSATLLTMEDKSTVKSCASEEYLSVGNPLVRNESLSTIPEERTSQMEKSYTIEEPADISFSFDGKEVTVSLYETPDLTHDEALQIIEMYADELSEHISEDNVVDLPSLRIIKESSISGPVMMEALVIDVPIDYCRQQTVSDTEFDGVSLTEDITLANNDKSDSICENSLEYFSDHLSSGNSKREEFYSASETTPKNSSIILKQQSEDDGHQSFQTPKLFMSDSDDQILTQLKLDERLLLQNSRPVTGPLARSESNNTEEEVSETLAEIENEPPLSHNYCASEIVTQSDEDGLYSTVLNKIRGKGIESVILSSEEDDVLKIISRPNVDEFLKYMKIILEGTMVKMHAHENFNFTSTMTELERSIQALHSLAWKFIEETERDNVTELDKNIADNVSSLMTAINASLLALEQIDDPFGVSDNVLNEIQSSVCFDFETLNNNDLPASVILDRLSGQIKNFTIVVNRQVARVTEQRIIAILRNTIGTTLVYIKTLQHNCFKIKCVDINSLTHLFSMVQPLETILNDIAIIEDASIDDNKPNLKLKQILIPPISSIAFALNNLNTALNNDSSDDDQDLKDIYKRINESTNKFMTLASQGTESNKIAECFISFTKPINDLCCHLRQLGRSTENIVSSDYGSDDKLLLDFETLFDELMIDIDTLINNVNFVQDSENNMNPLGSLLEPLQDMKIGLFQVNQVLLSNQTGSTMSYEVMNCFEHLSQQLVQLNNCIVNQSIVEETEKEIPFESSIKMMQNILFDDAIDDLGVNGILFGSVMKPLLQLQNLIVSKMASVESDLSFSEHTDVTGGACDTQSLSLSLSNNAQTVFDKTANENSKQVITESSIIDSLYTDCDKQKNIHRDTSEVDKDSILVENNINNDLVIKRGYECDIGETFKDEEPNIITSEDDRDNSGLEALFDETDLETISDFVEDTCLDNTASSKIDHKLSDLFISEKDIDNMLEETDDIIPEHVLESLEKSNQQDLIFNSPVDLLNELQDTLKNMSEVARVETTELYGLCTSNINDLQKMDSAYYINQICDKTNNLLYDSLDVEQMNNSTNINSDKLNKQNVTEPFEDNIETNQCNKIILKTDQNETFKNKDISISDQDVYKEEKVFEKGQDVDFVENFESLNSDKSISNNTIITVDEISDSSEVKMKEIDTTINLESVDNVASTTEKFSQIMYVPDINESLITYSIHNMMSEINDNAETITTSSDLKNETVLLDNLNFTESVKNINILSKKDIIIDKNKFNESEKINTLNDHGTENKDTVLIKEIEVPSITENVSPKSFSQNDVVINEIDANCNSGTDMIIPVAQTSNVNEFNTGKEKEIILIDKCTTEFNNVLGTLVEEKNCIAPENNLVIEDHNSPIVDEISNKIKQYDNSNLINKSIYVVEEKVTPINEPICSVVDNNSITVLENNIDNISKDIIEEQNSENEHLSLIKNKYNDSDIFEISQDVNLDEKLQHELQPNINTTSTTDNKQIIVTNFIKSENMANPIGTELNVLQTEVHALIKNHTNLSELTNKESLENVQQSYILQQSNNEVNTVEELNEQNDILSDMKVNNEIECISSKIVLPTEIINPENVINVRSVVEQCVSDSIIHTDDKLITQYNVDNCVDFMLPVIESMTQKVGSNELDKQLVITNINTEANEDKGEDHDNFDDIAIKSKIDVTKDFENLVDLTLNEKETASNEKINKYSENKTTQIKINDEEKSINTISNSFGNFKQPNILENNNTALLDENQDDIQFKVNIDSIYECNTILDSKDKISNLEQLETKKELLYIPDENEVETKLSSEIQNLQNDETKLITKSANIVVKQTTALICNEIISTSNAQPLDPILIDVENIKEQYEKELCVSESKNITVLDDIIDTVEKNNQQFDDVEEMSKDKLISKPLDTNNLTYDGNESEKSIPNEYIEGLKSIDEKSNSASSENIVKNNGEILEKINNLSTENVEEKILTKSQMSDESGVDDSLVENNCVTTFVDLKPTKTNIEKEEDICKIHASEISCLPLDKDQISGSNNLYLYDAENNLDKHKCLSLVKENKDNCNDRTSYPNTCIEILNENNVNQHKQFSECQTIVILENFDTLDTLLHKENTKTNTVIRDNEDKLNRNEDSVETKNRSEQNSIKNDTDKKQSPILIDVSKSMENKTDLVNNRNQTLCLCDTKFDNLNEKLTEDLKNNQEIDKNNFGKLLVHKNNLEDTDNLKNNEINTEEIKTKFINLKDFETSKTKLETTVDNIPKVDSNKSTKQKDLTFEKLSNLVIDELNISLETPKSECIFVNKNIDNKIIDLSKSNIFNNDNLHIDAEVDIIDQYDDSCKTEIQDMSDKSKEIINVISKNYPDNDSCDSNNSPINEVQENKSNTINENEENKPSKLKLDNINVNEDKLLNEVKMNDQMNVVTALENNANPLNDILFEGEISDMSAEEFGVISIMPKFHYVEKIAASGTECMMLENTNNLKQDELNAAENLKQHAQVEHELNIGTIGNIIIDNDSIKENSLTADDEKKCINNAIIVLTSDDSSLKIVSTNVDVLNAPTKDTTIKKDQIVINDLSENSTRTTMPLSENRNSEILIVDKLNDQIEIADNLIIENDEINIGSMDKSIEILNDKVVDKLQQSFQNAKNINSSLVISADENDTTEKVNENNILIDNIKTTNDKKTTNTKDKVDIKQKLNPKSKESSSQFTPTNNIGVYKNNIDKNKITIETIVQKNKELSDEIANTEQVTTKFKSEELTEKDVITDDQNKNQKNNGVDNNNKTLTESELEEGKNKRGSKKKRTSPQPESKKSPLLDTSEKDLSAIENEIDTNKIMDTNIVEKNKINSDDNKNTDKVDVKMDKTESTIVPDNIRNLEEKIEKDVSTNDQYQNQNNEITIDNQIKSTENDEEKDETKRRSKKKKSSPQIKDKKSTSPVSIKINFTASENKIGSIIIDKNIEENNKKLSEENNDTENVDVKLNKIDPEIASDNKINPEEIIDKGVSTDDQIKNQKNNGIDNNSKTLTENELEEGKNKRGSKNKRTSPKPESKKSPLLDTSKQNLSAIENEIDTNKIMDTNIVEKNKINSDDNKNTDKVDVKMDKTESTIVPDNIRNLEEKIEKDVSTNDQYQNQNNEITIDNQIKSTENDEEIDETKRRSKKKKSSPQIKDKKSTSPVSIKINFTASENKIGSIIIDKNIEENNKKLSEENNDTENVDVKLNKIDPAIASDNKINPEEIIDKGVSTDDQIKNQKNNGIDNNSKTLTENEIEEKNKKNSDDNKNTEKVEVKIDKIEPTIVLDNIKNSEEIITKDVSNINKNKNLKNNEYDEDAKLLEHRKDKKKRGSKKKKTSPEPEIKKLSSTDTKKNNINISEDDTVEENIRKISNDNKNTEQDRTKVEPGTTADNNTTKIIDKIKSAEHFVEKSETNPGSRKEKISSLRPEGEKSTSPNKTNKITNEKLKKNNEIEKNENTISDLTENFTKHLPDINTVLDKMEKLQDICSLDNNNIEIIGKSKNNKIETHLFTNTDKSDVEKNKNERDSVKLETSSKSPSLEKSVRTDTKVNVNIDDKLKNNTTNCFTTNKERKLPEMTEQDVVDVPEVRVLNKRPVNRYLLDVNDVHNLRQNTPAYRSLTPDPLASYRTLTPDHLSSHRSLTPESPSYRTSLTPRSKYAYACLSDRELYGRSSSNHSSRSSSRSTSPYPPESRISSRSLCPTNITAYRCLSETSIPLSPRRLEVETISGRLHTSYGVTTRRRRGSDSFLHDSGVRDGGYYSSWRLSDGRSTTYGAFEDLYRTKEAFKALYFCVRMIDQTVSSGARVKFWCSIIGHPKPRVQWYRDGQKLNSFTYNSSARYETKYDGGLAQLIINNAQSGDSGEYTCVASNDHDRISSTGFLTVYTSPSMFRKSLIQPSMSVDVIEFSRGLYSRTSHDFGLSANTKFDFNSRKLFGGDLANRRPEYPKFVSSIIADDVATYGGTIALQVRVQGSPVPNVTWMRESRPLPRLSGKYVYLDEGGLYTLLVMDSTARDGGTYVCRACNLYGAADAEKAVRVVSPQDYTDRRGVKPAIIVSRPNDRLNVAVGEDITVNLRVAGEPKPKVIWMRGSRDVTFLDRSLKETVNDYVTLSIKKAQPSDAGTYFIIAKNVYGSDRAFVTVGVRKRARSLTPPQIRNTIGRRFGPTGGRGDGGGGRGRGRGGCANDEVPGPVRSEPTVTDRANNRISLQWDRPEKPETVLVYRVETRSADEECWRQVGMTPTNAIDVYNLKPGYRYQFRVAARNRFGWSQPVAGEGYVDVLEPKCLPEFRQPLPGQTRVLLQHNATLQCHVRGVPEPRVRWFKDGELLLASNRHAVSRTDAGKCTLTIADAVDGDAGRYSCEAVNDQGRVCTLTVVQVITNRRIVEAERRLQGCLMKNNDFRESAPVFTKHLIDRRVDINSTVRLSCQVNGLPVPVVLWYKDGLPVDFAGTAWTNGDRKPPVRDDSDSFYTLELTGVKYDDSGAYTAVASNAIGKASTRCVLEVFNKNRTDPAVPSFVFGLPPATEAVDSIVLTAQIDAYRPAKVEWFRDGIQLRNGRRVDIITDHDGKLELRIACVTNRDSGTYMLRVSNDTGTVESRCDVNVVEREHNDTGMEQISLINHLYSKKPKFVVKPKFQEVEEGQEVIIDSEIVGDPLPKITWLRDGLKPEYYRDNSEFLCISNGNRYQLKIPHAKLTHTGTYTLQAANPHGQIKALISLQVYSTGHCKKKMENGTNHTTVERLPRISRGLVDIECRENDSVSFECKLNITQETDIRWQKDGKLVRLGKQIKSQLVDGDTARLDISTASPLHEGLYTCTAFNELGQDSTSARLTLLSDSQETAKASQSNGQRKTIIGSPILAGETNDRCTKRLKRSSAPKFYAVLHDRIADVGETVRFLCSVSGHPPPWSSWEKDGQPIGVNSRIRIREDDDHRSLEIYDVTSDDAGIYRITVENKFGKIQATARLEVLTHNQPTNDVKITSSSNGRRQSGSAACAGEKFTLSCDISGNSMSDVTWYKDDVEVKPDGRVTSSLDDLAARLSISNLESEDTGVYTCVARCESGVTRCTTELCVFDSKPATDSYLQPPIFVEGLVPKRTTDEGEPVQLTVRLQGAVPMNASWFKNDVPVPDCADFEYVVAEDRGEFGLLIIDPFVKDSGTYSCKVTNTFGQAMSSGQLVINEMTSEHQTPKVIELNNNMQQNVREKTSCDSKVATRTALPASILRGPCDTTVLRGAKVVLETSYRGDPEPCVQWLRAGKVLESDAHLCITNESGVSSLTIDSITADDCGKYVVRVDNGVGNDFHFASVAVEGPPDPPAGRPVVSVSETSADVTWSSPAYDGGCMVTGYGVEVRPFNQSDWKLVADKCHSLSHIVRGLAAGESYVFRVRAENMHGSSEASLESTPVYILQTDYGNTLSPKTVNIENGVLFDEQYEVLDELGKGRYGVVYKVKERESSKYYAAKFVRCIKSTDKEKAQEEVDIMNCLRHPKLLQLDAAFDKPREVVLVTEYISGGELFERVVADDFTLTEKDCILFTRQICEGVDYMHKQNVVHLDLKPENIMCQSRTSHYVKLIDFGLAQKIVPGQPMRVLFGTPEFIPPEIIGYEPIGLESDMWSVGVICYVLLSGLSPFMGDNDPETFTNITKAEFDFDDEAFDAVSQDAKDFISALLIKRKELRLTARECLKHKWLAQQDMDMSCVILSTDKLKKFIIRRKWQKTGNAIRALGRMATLSAASRRGVIGGSSAGGGGGTGSGSGTGSVLQKLKMASLREEESAGESSLETQEIAITETMKCGSGHKSCDARSDSGFSDCPSVVSPTAMLARPSECPTTISEETPTVPDQDRSPPPPTRRSPSPTTHRSSSPTTHRSPSPNNRHSLLPLTCRPSSPATRRPFPPTTRGPSSPATRGSSSSTTRGSSYPATRGPSPLATHLRSPLPRNRRDATHPVHDVPLPTGTAVSNVCKTNRIIFDGGRRDGSASSPGMAGGSGVQRKEPIRIQTADNFKKAVAFWKQ